MRFATLSLFLVCLPLPASVVAAGPGAADLLIHGGTIYTLAEEQPVSVEALAIGAGAVLAAGSLSDLEPLVGSRTQRLDLQGAWAVPGLVDAHAHVFGLGRLLERVNLIGTASAQACVDLARERASTLPEGAWLLGRGWDQNDWAEPVFPDKSLLDEAFGDRPVRLRRVDGHASWVNSAALRLAGVTRDTPDPEGGEFHRDPGTGELTGILIDAADDIVYAAIPPASDTDRLRHLRLGSAAAAAAGLTGIHEMGVTAPALAALERAVAEGWLPLRIVAYLEGDETLAQYDGGPSPPRPDTLLRVHGVKLYSDGALGSRGAALLADYADRPGHRGQLIMTEEELANRVSRALARGFSVAIHAIGDRANHVSLNALAAGHARATQLVPELPPLSACRVRIEHAQVLAPADLPRFRRLGVIPSMQPTHCTSDMPWAPDRLGPERLAGAYAWRTLLADGNLLPLGSDCPAESISPLLGLWAARTRQAPDGTPPAGWAPEQRLTALEALLGFTVWPARAVGIPQWGRLAPGCRADVTILDRDPLAEDAREVLTAEVLVTLVEGEVRYRRSGD